VLFVHDLDGVGNDLSVLKTECFTQTTPMSLMLSSFCSLIHRLRCHTHFGYPNYFSESATGTPSCLDNRFLYGAVTIAACESHFETAGSKLNFNILIFVLGA
jgi:hypothetical protein